MKPILIIIPLALLIILHIQCTMKTPTVDLSQANIKIDSCGLMYKGHLLELDTPAQEWIKVLGEPSRTIGVGPVWDNLGIVLDEFQNENGMVARVYIFFLNLDSPDGQAGKLNNARDFESAQHVADRNMKNGVSLISDEIMKEIQTNNKKNKKNYIYPYTTYQGYVSLHDCPIKSGMKVEEINAYRENLPYSTKFRYIDQAIDGVNDSGVTNKTFGGDYKSSGTACKDGRLQFYRLNYNANHNLEYLMIGYESLSDYKSRKKYEKI